MPDSYLFLLKASVARTCFLGPRFFILSRTKSRRVSEMRLRHRWAVLDFECGIRVMKRFIAMVALCLAINPAIKPDQHTKESKAANDKEREPPVVVFDDGKTTAETNSEPQERPKWYRTVNWSNWALLLVGVITGFAVGWQARETAKSAKAAQRSVELQEVLNQQWLEFENWKIMGGGTDAEIGTVILISFDIVNTTKMPLTISGYCVSVKGQDTSVQFARTIAPAKSRGTTWRQPVPQVLGHAGKPMLSAHIDGETVTILQS